ncbi:MAG: hypothetical protein KF760_16425 [Candidatus Eremiobacteraeota bacterium]|nr:hypothetical protein [Candidatus Eremiobacteraeota bacterium]MCW5867587.1 hypothetical protein [Candidatus Eremiobacteraeota bacterium]
MDSQDSSIEEKLVPFVEGALAEADRREVLQALPNQPALNQEVRQLRETIMSLRGQAARGLSYQSPVEAPPEQVVDFALQGDQWSRQSSRQFQLHLLESASLSEELEILRELEQDLQQRVEPTTAVPEMPAALRQAIQDTYGKPPADPVWKRAAAAIVAWTAGLNLKVASAAVAGCVLVVGAVTVTRMNHQPVRTTVAVATTAPAAASASPGPAEASPEPAPAGQVALLQEKVLPEDLPGLSRRLWTKQVSHSYRDGQIYVAQADFDKAWAALQMNNEKATGSKALKTGAVAIDDRRTNLLDGVIGQLPPGDRKAEVKVKQPDPPAAASHQVPAAQPGNMVGGGPDSKPAVAVDLPAPPEASQGSYAPPPGPASNEAAPHYYQKERARAAEPVVPRQAAPAPVPVRQPRTAAGAAHTTSAPTQMARTGPASGAGEKDAGAVAPGKAPATSPTRIGRVFQPSRQQPASANNRPADQVAAEYRSEPAAEAPAPPIEALRKPAEPRPANSSVPPASTRPKTQAITPPPPPAPIAMGNSNAEVVTEEENTPPVPAPVLQEQKKKGDVEEGKVNNNVLPTRSDEQARPKVDYRDNAGASRASMSAQAGRSGVARDESFQVKAGAPFEVAMLPVAKKLVEDLVGEAKVQMERKEDGHLLVTIRPTRSLSPQEVDKLRKVVREKLELKEEDTVVIRQP